MLTRAFNRFWIRPLRSATKEYEHARKPLTDEQKKTLVENATETAKEARTLFLLHLSLTAYGFLTVASTRDHDIYAARPSLKLPVLDVQVTASMFFVALPLLTILVSTYMQLYLGYLERLTRRLRLGAKDFDDPDLHYPWVATIAQQGGVHGRITAHTFGFLSWCATPALLTFATLRLLPMRSSVFGWLMPGDELGWHGLPAASVLGASALASATFSWIWSTARYRLNSELGLRPRKHFPVACRLALAAPVAVVAAISWLDVPYTLRESPFLVVDLRLEALSTPGAEGRPATGAFLRGVDATAGLLTGAFLENAYLQGSRLAGANLDSANLSGAVFADKPFPGRGAADLTNASLGRTSLRQARLCGAKLGRAFFLDTDARGADLANADLRKAKLWGANLDFANFYQTDLSGSTLQNASFAFASLNHAILDSIGVQGGDGTGATFINATLKKKAGLRSVSLDGATFVGAELNGASFYASSLVGANLDRADLRDARFERVDLTGASLRGACVERATFNEVTWEGADLRDLVFSGCGKEHSSGGTRVREHLHVGPAQICGNPGEDGPVITDDKTCRQAQLALVRKAAEQRSSVGRLLRNARWMRDRFRLVVDSPEEPAVRTVSCGR